MHGEPRRLAAIGLPLGVTYDLGRRLTLIDADQQALSSCPGRVLALRLAMSANLLVDRVGGPAHGQLA